MPVYASVSSFTSFFDSEMPQALSARTACEGAMRFSPSLSKSRKKSCTRRVLTPTTSRSSRSVLSVPAGSPSKAASPTREDSVAVADGAAEEASIPAEQCAGERGLGRRPGRTSDKRLLPWR